MLNVVVLVLVLAGYESATGDSIAFSRTGDGDRETFVMSADGTEVYSTGQQGIPSDWG